MIDSASSSSSFSQSFTCSSMCASVSASSESFARTFSSRSKILIAYQRICAFGTSFSIDSSMCASACSTLPVKTCGASPGLCARAASTAASAASRMPSPLSAEISTTLQPSSCASLRRSIRSPFLRTTSIMFTATTTGMPSETSWVVR